MITETNNRCKTNILNRKISKYCETIVIINKDPDVINPDVDNTGKKMA
jgi:hypothetical protein